MQTLNPCLWFDHDAEAASQFYTSLFKKSSIGKTALYGESGAAVSGQKSGSVMTVEFEIEGLKIVALNGGPIFKFTPAMSFFVWCKSTEEINRLWKSLAEAGKTRMELDQYPWAKRYGWTADRYGVEWQLMLAEDRKHQHKIAPAFLFVDALFGKGEEAVNFYVSTFANSDGNGGIVNIARDVETKSLLHCEFQLLGQALVLSEGKGKHGHAFNEAFSLMVNCDTQEEIDQFWAKLSAGGSESQCGWLKDKFGVSWQIVPKIVAELMADPEKAEPVMKTMLGMKKLNIKELSRSAQL